ncbi:MAG: hypothetical protein Kow00121_25750 [Elainellaceae cyanobacterium]
MADFLSGYPLHFYGVTLAPDGDYQQAAQFVQDYLAQVTAWCQLPPDPPGFTGRTAETQHIFALVGQTIQDNRKTATVVVVTGQPGVGKSTLVAHLAHRLVDQFPDIQLYVDLRGTDQNPRSPSTVLASLLRLCGITEPIPESEIERSRRWQAICQDKRMLLVLDNAADEEQINALIPQLGASIVFVTSRQRLTTLTGSIVLELPELSEFESTDLLRKLVNGGISHFLPGYIQEVVQHCQGLPLALRLAAGAVQQRSARTAADRIEQLIQDYQRMSQLRSGYAHLRPGFALIYQQLDTQVARLLRLLGLLSDGRFNLSIAAALLDTNSNTAGQTIGQLVEFKLVKRLGGERYQLVHDAVRFLARGQLAGEETADERQAARLRISRWYLHACHMMSLGLHPQTRRALSQAANQSKWRSSMHLEQPFLNGALIWFELERFNIFAALEWAVNAQAWEIVIAFVEYLVPFFHYHHSWTDQENSYQQALAAAKQLNDRQRHAQWLNNLGNLYQQQQQMQKAKEHYEQSLLILRDLENAQLMSETLANLGALSAQQGETQAAYDTWKQALMQLPVSSTEHKQLRKWMEMMNPALYRSVCTELDEQSSGGLLQTVSQAIKRFVR